MNKTFALRYHSARSVEKRQRYKKFVEHSFLFTLVKRNECGRISFRSVSVLGAYLVLPRDPKSQVCTDLVEIGSGKNGSYDFDENW